MIAQLKSPATNHVPRAADKTKADGSGAGDDDAAVFT